MATLLLALFVIPMLGVLVRANVKAARGRGRHARGLDMGRRSPGALFRDPSATYDRAWKAHGARG